MAASSASARARISWRDSGENSANAELLVVELLRRAGNRPWLRAVRRFSSQIWCCDSALRAFATLARRLSCSAGGQRGDLLPRFRRRASTMRPAFCFDRGFRVHLRNARRVQHFAHLRRGSAAIRRAACRGSSGARGPARIPAPAGCTAHRRRCACRSADSSASPAASGFSSDRIRVRGAAAARRPGWRATASARSMGSSAAR